MVIPSRQDNLPNTGLEAHACGTPVITFKVGGLPDIVDHLNTGYLAAPFDIEDLARGVQWVLAEGDLSKSLGEAARQRALNLWAPQVDTAEPSRGQPHRDIAFHANHILPLMGFQPL
jgi:glycosyltransferase involved in cell wall biosynthesis